MPSNAGADKYIGPATKVVDLHGEMVLPGFHDSHIHPVTSGIELGQCNLHGSRTVDELLETIRQCGNTTYAMLKASTGPACLHTERVPLGRLWSSRPPVQG